ncbi:MAG: LytTR family DNA-binding domain-containing protein [Eubacteriales bacterium]|nr:LytTR family DNA-binding domain-containing protein [Eubacteriales bacterium]
MKILFDIQKSYREPEIHICCDKRSEETIRIKESVEKLFDRKITAYKNHEMKSVGLRHVVRIFSESKKVYLRTADDTYEVRERLYTLDSELPEKEFVRISNSEIVNVSMIEKLDMGYAGTIRIFMENGDEAFVSRRYVSKIREVLG